MRVEESHVRTGATVGGHPVLNFANTCGGGGKERDVERLIEWRDAVDWAVANGVLNSTDRRRMEKPLLWAGHSQSDTLKALTELRETVHAVFCAIAGGMLPSEAVRLRLEGYILEALRHSTLSIEGQVPARWKVCPEKAGTALIQDRLAVAANDLLSQPLLSNVRECSACSWLFLDLSRSKSRRWCSMATCGNRAKAQRHYHTMKATY